MELMQGDMLAKAAHHATESAALLCQGKLDEAEEKLTEISTKIKRTRAIDALRADILEKLQSAGIEQPPVDFLQKLAEAPTEPLTTPVQTLQSSDVGILLEKFGDGSPELAETEIYLLAKIISEAGQREVLTELGIRYFAEEQQEVKTILAKYDKFKKTEGENNQALLGLAVKLRAFVNDKEKVFRENIKNEDALILLAMLSPIEPENQLQKLFILFQGQAGGASDIATDDDDLKSYKDALSTLPQEKALTIKLEEGESKEKVIESVRRAAEEIGREVKITLGSEGDVLYVTFNSLS